MMNLYMAREVGLLRYVVRRLLWRGIRIAGKTLSFDFWPWHLSDGTRMKLPLNSPFASDIFCTNNLVDWGAETLLLDYLQSCQKGVALDVGANMGYYSCLLSSSVNQVFAFEPDERNHQDFLRHKPDNVELVAMAVSDVSGIMSFDVSSASTISHLLTDEQSASKTVAVEVTTIDSFIHNHRHAAPVRVVKMDIEGFEILALKGATELISRDQPLFLIEYALESGAPNSTDALHDFLAHHEYFMYALARTPAAFWRYETRLQKIQAGDIPCLDIKMLFLVPPSALKWFEAKEAEGFCSGV